MRLFEKEELLKRISRFQNKMIKSNIDIALFSLNSDLFYFTGSIQKGLLLIFAKKEPIYFVQKNLSRAKDETPISIEMFSKEKIKKLLSLEKNIGLPMDVTLLSDLNFFKRKLFSSHHEIKDISLILALTKSIKTKKELDFIIKAADINIKIMSYAKEVFYPGINDIEMQAEIEFFAKKELGHQQLFWTRGQNMDAGMSLVVTGISALQPTYTNFPIGGKGVNPSIAQGPCGDVIEDSFVVDFIGTFNGYNADSTRTFFVKEPNKNIVKIYNELNELMKKIVDFIKPGVLAKDVWNFTLKSVENYDWKDGFMGLEQKVKFIGHGIGTEVNQLPVIASKQEIPFENNMVFAIEPKVFVKNYGIIGIENTFLLSNESTVSLTGYTENIEDFIIT
jgi:Xaa-Pro aminopeptidase